MKLRKILTLLSAAAGLSLASGAAIAETEGYLSIWSSTVKVAGKGDKKTLTMDIQTAKPIPVDGKSGAFGYAALTDNANNLLVLVTHLPIDDSSHEDPTNGFHTHVLDLKEPTAACAGANFEVDLENSGKNAAFDADYPWKVKGSKISVENVPVKDLGDAGVDTIVSFTLKPVLDAQQKPANLCVTVADKG
ncbi:hypothetical protein [Candidatus Methylomicrobium oryzae]|jgi:hypothetical protein|uniref:hypothetical protein n=1 Tax=Candidatus Methylomicrobium oryzae TaxID=2802053 RepID=UPI001921EC29|nr:hypothetical protein [Methylomicrobium sp. RS1]MBL1264421.1 hypothetical protein [Methylomicrobium sp. RS1]